MSDPMHDTASSVTVAVPPGGRRTKIIGTIGPSSQSVECLDALIRAGLDVVRLNMSHGTHDDHATVIERTRYLARQYGRPISILLDLQGPKIRTGALVNGQSVQLVTGQTLRITTRPVSGTAELVSTTYQDLPHDVTVGDSILMDDGLLELRVTSVQGDEVSCLIVHGGTLKEHKGINLPGVKVSAPALTDKDRVDLQFGLQQGVDYIALSFVRHPDDLAAARSIIASAAGLQTPVIAKLEKPEALTHLDAIIRASDGVMIARGDLGVELSPERVPIIQKQIIARANELGVLVITATQMLESMISQPRPTRAEASDVANAILDDTDAVMLSGETAAGAFPVETVLMMDRIIRVAEASKPQRVDRRTDTTSHAHAIAHAAAVLAHDTEVCSVVVFTRSGFSARLVAKERPQVPIIAFTERQSVYQQLGLWWGVLPIRGDFHGTTDEQLLRCEEILRDSGLAHPGDTIVMVGSLPMIEHGRSNFLKLHSLAAQ